MSLTRVCLAAFLLSAFSTNAANAAQESVGAKVREFAKQINGCFRKCPGCLGSGDQRKTHANRKRPTYKLARQQYVLTAPSELRWYRAEIRWETKYLPRDPKIGNCVYCDGFGRLLLRSKIQNALNSYFKLRDFENANSAALARSKSARARIKAIREDIDEVKWHLMMTGDELKPLVFSKKSPVGTAVVCSGEIVATRADSIVVRVSAYVKAVVIVAQKPPGTRWVTGTRIAIVGLVVGDTSYTVLYAGGEKDFETVLVKPYDWK